VKFHLVVVKLLFGCLFAMAARSASPEKPWDALRHLLKHHVYTVLNRDGSCFTGAFVSVSDNTLVLDPHSER
jgi:hypothetical protein